MSCQQILVFEAEYKTKFWLNWKAEQEDICMDVYVYSQKTYIHFNSC